MSFTAITAGEIASGQSVKTTTQTLVRTNFDDHESRIQALEAGSTGLPPIIFSVSGRYSDWGAIDEVIFTTATYTFDITGARIIIRDAGSAGTLEIDIKKKRGGGSWTSIFTTKPSVLFSAGDYAVSSNAIFDPDEIDVIAGDLLRLDITSVQTDATGFIVRLDQTRD